MRITENKLRRIIRESLLSEGQLRPGIRWPPGAWDGPHMRSASGETLDDVALIVINAIDAGAVDIADEDAIQSLIDVELENAGVHGSDRVEWGERVWTRLPETF